MKLTQLNDYVKISFPIENGKMTLDIHVTTRFRNIVSYMLFGFDGLVKKYNWNNVVCGSNYIIFMTNKNLIHYIWIILKDIKDILNYVKRNQH